MECLLCDFQFNKVNLGKNHYVCFHKVDENNLHFLDLFEPDTIDCVCHICNVKFDTCGKKKNHMFLYHYSTKHSGCRLQTARDLPLNILKRGAITIYSANFDQHKDFYDFHISDMIDVFLDNFHLAFNSQNHMYKFQGYFEIINQQRGPEIVLEDKRVWLTNFYRFKYFNYFDRGEIKDKITKRVSVNGQSGSSWFFKRFNRLNIIVVPLLNELKLVTS